MYGLFWVYIREVCFDKFLTENVLEIRPSRSGNMHYRKNISTRDEDTCLRLPPYKCFGLVTCVLRDPVQANLTKFSGFTEFSVRVGNEPISVT